LNFQNKCIILLGVFSVFIILISGCSYVTPDYDNYTVSYIRVVPYFATMEVNTSKIFTVKAYDAEDNIIPVDSSEVSWELAYECPACDGIGVINPKSGSLSTSFTPYRTGLYHIYAYYKGKKDNSPIKVIP